jgi:hypothetical protein
LTAPAVIPTNRPARTLPIAKLGLGLSPNKVTIVTLERVSIVPREISIPPVRTTNVCPIARKQRGKMEDRLFVRL